MDFKACIYLVLLVLKKNGYYVHNMDILENVWKNEVEKLNMGRVFDRPKEAFICLGGYSSTKQGTFEISPFMSSNIRQFFAFFNPFF